MAALELPSLRGNEDAPADQDPLPSACPETAETLLLQGGSGSDPTAEDVSGIGFAQGKLGPELGRYDLWMFVTYFG